MPGSSTSAIGLIWIMSTAHLGAPAASPPRAATLVETTWRMTLESQQYGAIEAMLTFDQRGDSLVGHSLSGARDVIARLPKAQAPGVMLGDHVFAMTVAGSDSGYRGRLIAPWSVGSIELTRTEAGFRGRIAEGRFAGTLSAVPSGPGERVERDYPAVLAAARGVIAKRLFDPAIAREAAYDSLMRSLAAITEVARDDLDFLVGFSLAYDNRPFSHLRFRREPKPVAELVAGFDRQQAGPGAVRLELRDEVAVLTVRTMIGQDTIERIDSAYVEIERAGAKALVIDLRGNGGGAFAIKPLIEHVIDAPYDAGVFTSSAWAARGKGPPGPADVKGLQPWQGWSVIDFWRDAQTRDLLLLRFEPRTPNFDGPVFVVTDRRSASATELVADAFLHSGAATLVGERTKGAMLSQSPFDAKDGFVVMLPVADYASLAGGRIEGRGVEPQVSVPSGDALERAMELARLAIARGTTRR